MRSGHFLHWFIFLLFFITACQHRPNDNYSVLAYDSTENVIHSGLSSLDSGNIDLGKSDATRNELFFTHKGNAYFGIANDTGNLVKYQIKNGRLVKAKEMPFGQVTGWTPVASFYSWVSDKELLVGSSRKGRNFMYALIDVDAMQIIKHGDLAIPLPPAGMRYGGVMGRLADKTLYIAYMIYRYDDRKAPAGDTTYLASVDFPSMKTRAITKDTRSTFPGGYNLFWQVSTVANGYLYFMEEPGSRLRYHPRYKPAILRIKIGEDHIDPDYYFPLVDQPYQEFYGLFDLGEGQALVKAFDTRKFREFSDFFYANAVTYYQVDLAGKTKTKLSLPPDRLDFHPNILRDGNLIHIAITGKSGASDIWSYDLKSHQYQKGLHLNGQVLFLDKLN